MKEITLPPVADPVSVWDTYVAFFGNASRTAAEHKIPLQSVLDLADAGRWPARMAGVSAVSVADRNVTTDNRALNLVQAARLRDVLGRVVHELETRPEALDDFTTVTSKNGSTRSVKALTDLAKAIATAQDMTYKALGDGGGATVTTPADVSKVAEAVAQAFSSADRLGVALTRQKIPDAPPDHRP